MFGRRKKWLLFWCLLPPLVALAAALAYPLWFPALLRPLAKRSGVTYNTCVRVGWDRLALTDVRFGDADARVEIQKVECLAPVRWAWRVWRDGSAGADTFARLEGVKIILPDTSQSGLPRRWPAPHEQFQRLQSHLGLAHRWLPVVRVSNGVVVWQDRELRFGPMVWDRGSLTGELAWPGFAAPARLSANVPVRGPVDLDLRIDRFGLDAKLRMAETNGALSVDGNLVWKTVRADGLARFGPGDRLPSEARLRCDTFQIPGDLVGFTPYGQIAGAFAADWRTNGFSLSLRAKALASAEAMAAPDLDLDLRANGGTNRFRLGKLRFATAGFVADLAEPAELDFSGRLLSERGTIRLSADLRNLPGLAARGELEGSVVFRPAPGGIPSMVVNLGGTNLRFGSTDLPRLRLEAGLDWPMFELRSAEAEFGQGPSLSARARGNLATRWIDEGRLRLSGAPRRGALPSGFGCESVDLEASCSGSVTQLVHSATLRLANWKMPHFTPQTINAHWKGTNSTVGDFGARVAAAGGSVTLAGAAELRRDAMGFRCDTLVLAKGEEPLLSLAEPFRIGVSNPANQAGLGVDGARGFTLGTVRLRGAGRELALSGMFRSPDAAVSLVLTNLEPSLLQPFFEQSMNPLALRKARLDASLAHGVFLGSGSASFSAFLDGATEFAADLDFEAVPGRLKVTRLAVSETARLVLEAKAELPLSLTPLRPGRRFAFDFGQPISVRASSETNAVFWNQLATMTGLDLGHPFASLEVDGAIREPQGRIRFSTEHLGFADARTNFPSLGDVRLVLRLDKDKAIVEQGSLLLEGQPVALGGQMRLGPEFWTGRPEEIAPYLLKNSTVRLSSEHFQVKALARLFPGLLMAQGEADLDISLLPDKRFAGDLALRKLATEPIQSLGALRDVDASILFEGQTATVTKLQGVLGGEPVVVKGTVDFSNALAKPGWPLLNLTVKGENLPLARNPDLVLRGDLDLVVTNRSRGEPVIGGVVNLKNSYFLGDLGTLVPRRLAKAGQRPPYFSVEREPWSAIQLDLRVRGEKFVKLRGAFFEGEASAALKIGGSLGDPVALGDVTLNSGLVKFPFANLVVQQGIATLGEEDSHRPKVLVTAGSRAFGYELKMQTRGFADEPVIEFASVPPLTSEQVVLMITAGELPHREVTFGNTDKAGNLALFFGKGLWSKLKSGAGGGERLIVRSGEDLSEQGKQTYYVEYKLSENWSLVGEYDRFSALNAGFKWRFYSK